MKLSLNYSLNANEIARNSIISCEQFLLSKISYDFNNSIFIGRLLLKLFLFQGRLPIRAELQPLTSSDFKCILRETKFNLLIQQCELLKTEGVTLEFSDDAIDEIAEAAYQLNTGDLSLIVVYDLNHIIINNRS